MNKIWHTLVMVVLAALMSGCVTSPATTTTTLVTTTTTTTTTTTSMAATTSTLVYTPVNDSKLVYCEKDEDCIQVPDYENPGCTRSGRATVINRIYGEYWMDKLRMERYGVGGATVWSRHRSCYSIPKCVNNTCILVDECEKNEDCERASLHFTLPGGVNSTLNCVNNKCQLIKNLS